MCWGLGGGTTRLGWTASDHFPSRYNVPDGFGVTGGTIHSQCRRASVIVKQLEQPARPPFWSYPGLNVLHMSWFRTLQPAAV